MPVVRKVGVGESASGISAAAQTDSFRAAYLPPEGTQLTTATVSAARNGGAISAAELNGRVLAIVYVRQAEDEPQNMATATIIGQQGFPQSLRVIGAAFVGDARFGGGIIKISLSYKVQRGDQIVIEVSPWVDSTGAVVASQSMVTLHGKVPRKTRKLVK